MFNFKNLSVGFDKPILENLNAELKNGAVTFLIGPNGSGKTSLLKTLSNILPPLTGTVSSEVSVYLPSSIHLQNGLTGNDLMDLYAVKTSKWYDESLLEFFEIKNLLSISLDSLSTGERQRIFLCAVLSHNSSYVFLDEPLNHLDWNFSLKLKKILNDQSQKGRTFLISNHDLNWALSFQKTQTWVLYAQSIFLNNSTESVLNDIKLQNVFRIKTEVVDLKTKKIISLTEL